MCTRVGFFDDVQWLDALQTAGIHYRDQIGGLKPRYNIAPSHAIATLLNRGDYTFTQLGLLPHWSHQKRAPLVNARAETLGQKASFQDSYRFRRCLIPVNGFYEWNGAGKSKTPYWVHPSEETFFALAGIWDQWIDNSDGEQITSSAIITTTPNAKMRKIHDRMPVILRPDAWKSWLDPDIEEPALLSSLFTPLDDRWMQMHEVSTYMNRPSNDTHRCIEPMRNTLF